MKTEEGASQEIQTASRSWKKQGNILLLNPWKEHSPADALILAQGEPQQTTSLLTLCKRTHLCCSKPTCGHCYSSARKVTECSVCSVLNPAPPPTLTARTHPPRVHWGSAPRAVGACALQVPAPCPCPCGAQGRFHGPSPHWL